MYTGAGKHPALNY